MNEILGLEKQLLSSVMYFTETLLIHFISKVKEKHFNNREHKQLYKAISDYFNSKPENHLNIELSNFIKFNYQNLEALLTDLVRYRGDILTTFDFDNAFNKLNDLIIANKLNLLLQKHLEISKDGLGLDLLKGLQTDIDNLTNEISLNTIKDLSLTQIANDYFTKGKSELISTYLKGISFELTNFIVIAGYSGQGKTFLAINLINDLVKNKYRVGLISLEMNNREIFERFICLNQSLTKENLKDIEPAKIIKRIDNIKFKVSQNSYDLNSIVNLIKLWKMRDKIDIIFIDYISLIENSDKKLSKYDFISEVSRKLKLLAKELNITIIGLQQLNRSGAKDGKGYNVADSYKLRADSDYFYIIQNCYDSEIKQIPINDKVYYTKENDYLLIQDKTRHTKTGLKILLAMNKYLGLYPIEITEQDLFIPNKRN